MLPNSHQNGKIEYSSRKRKQHINIFRICKLSITMQWKQSSSMWSIYLCDLSLCQLLGGKLDMERERIQYGLNILHISVSTFARKLRPFLEHVCAGLALTTPVGRWSVALISFFLFTQWLNGSWFPPGTEPDLAVRFLITAPPGNLRLWFL